MNRLLWLALLRFLRRHPWQLALSVAGITLGVAVVMAVDLANASARKSFELARQQLSGGTDYRIVSTRAGNNIPQALYQSLRVQHGFTQIAPVITGFIRLKHQPGRQLRLLGLDPLAVIKQSNDATLTASSGSFSELLVSDSSDSTAETTVALLRQLLTNPNSVLLSAQDAASDAANGRITALINDAEVPLQAVDYLNDPRFDGLVVTDIATAQALLDTPATLSYITVGLTNTGDDAQAAATLQRLRELLPNGITLERSAERDQSLAELSASFGLNLTAMSLLALVVGMFLIYNTMTFAVVQRRELLGLLRALGVSRRELFTIILGESLLLGAIGTLLGCLVGLLLATFLVDLVTRTVSDLYYTLNVTTFYVSPFTLLKALLAGLLATGLAAILPAIEATRAPPGASLSRAHLETRWQASLPRLSLGGLLLLALSTLLLLFTQSLIAGFGGIFLLIIGCALLVPLCVQLLSRGLSRLAPEPLSAMALRGIGRHLSRTGVAVAALMVAFSATVGVGIMVDSFRGGVVNWLEQLLTADLYVTPPGGADLHPELVEQLANLPSIAAVSSYRWIKTDFNDRPLQLGAVELAAPTRAGYRLLEGQPETAWQAFSERQAVLISEPLAYRQELGVNDRLTLDTATGPQTFAIAGVFHDYGSEHGRALIDLSTYRRYWQDHGLTSLALYAAPDQPLPDLRQRVIELANPLQPLELYSNRDILDLSLQVFDRTFLITSVLRLLAIAVALLGMLGALLALQLERTGEFAVLRALGMTPLQVGGLAWLQSGFMGLLAGLLALPVGLLLASQLIFTINRRAFGWTLPFQVDVGLLLQSLLLAVLAALLAGLYPLWQQRRASITDGLRTE